MAYVRLERLGGCGHLTEPADLLVEGVEHSLKLHLRHLGEHPDVPDVPDRCALAARALGDGRGAVDSPLGGYLW